MAWPLSQDYNEAIQDPQSCFSDPELKAGEAVTNALGMPMPRSGNFADVYEFNTPATKSKWAIKCFTRHVSGLRERYTEISAGLLTAKLPFAVEFQYLVQGIRVRGDWFPILKMRWVEGLLLNELVRDNLDKPALLGNLGIIWGRMAKRLRESNIAHADLQHGNVILIPGSKAGSLAVKLIDYDGMFVPALSGKKSGEVGHPNYQHPQRLRDGTYNVEVDRFPLLVVATALQALSVGGRELWDRYDNSDNLLFRETDFQAPGKSILFAELRKLPDPKTRMLVDELLKALERKLEDVPAIDALLPEAKATTTRAAEPVKTPNVAMAELVTTPAVTSPMDFSDPDGPVLPRKPAKKGGVPPWIWLAGGAAVAALFIAVVGIAGVAIMLGGPGNPKKVKGGPDGTNDQIAKDKEKDRKLKDIGSTKDKESDKKKQDNVNPPPDKPKGAAEITNSIGMKFVWIPPGSFTMGSPKEEAGRRATPAEDQHEVTLTKGFYMGAYTVTQEDWQAVMGNNPSEFRGQNRLPVENVSWDDCQEFCRKLRQKDDKPYRLPTEAEWEYACRARTTMPFHFGETISTGQANYIGDFTYGNGKTGVNRKKTTPVGTFPANAFGLYDMHGNVWQWCQEFVGEYPKEAAVDPQGPKTGTDRVQRGGSWDNNPAACRSACRSGSEPGNRFNRVGFRVCFFPDSAKPVGPIADADGFVPLFNGKDLTDWRQGPKLKTDWRVEKGILTSFGGGYLYTERGDYEDFHLKARVRVADRAHCVVCFRSKFTPSEGRFHPNSYMAHVNSTAGSFIKTGSLSIIGDDIKGTAVVGLVRESAVPAVTWCKLEVIAKGNHFVILVDGKETANWEDGDNRYARGHIAIARWGGELCEFSEIEIRELKSGNVDTPIAKAGMADDGFGVGTKLKGSNYRSWVVNGKLFSDRSDDVEVTVKTRSGNMFTAEFWQNGGKGGWELTGSVSNKEVKFTVRKALVPDRGGVVDDQTFKGRFENGDLKGEITSKTSPTYKGEIRLTVVPQAKALPEKEEPEKQPPLEKPVYRIEGENMNVLKKSDNLKHEPQQVGKFPFAKWSGDAQLWIKTNRQDEWIDLELPVAKPGMHRVTAYMTKARDYGKVQFYLNDKPLGKPIDGFNSPNVISTGAIDLGTIDLPKNSAVLRLQLVGTNEMSIGDAYMAGLDCIELERVSIADADDIGVLPRGADGQPLNLDFETGTLKDWTAEGDAFAGAPKKDGTRNHQGQYWIRGFNQLGDKPQGTLTSAPFKITHPWGSFLVGGGPYTDTCVELVLRDQNQVFFRASGIQDEMLLRVPVDLQQHKGKEMFIRLVDKCSGPWGHVNFDDFRFHDKKPNFPPRPDLIPVATALFTGEDLRNLHRDPQNSRCDVRNGELVIHGPAMGIVTNRYDFKDFTVRVDMSASADAEAFLVLRQRRSEKGPWQGMSTRILSNGTTIARA